MQINHYDGEGLRHEMEENGKLVKFLYADREVVAEEKENGNIIRFIRGYDLVASDSENARTYYHYASDEQGSITHILSEDENGEYSLKNYYEYGAFGDFLEKEEEVENRFGYNGEIFDPIGGQYYLRARYYNPVIGRFKQEDTYYGDGLNLYAYCRNLPIGYEDPSGHWRTICEQKYNRLKGEHEGIDVDSLDPKARKQYEKEEAQMRRYEKAKAKREEKAAKKSSSGRKSGEYHTFYEFELDIKDYLRSDSVQFRKANKALIKKLNSDSNFKKKLLSAHPEMKQWLDNPNLSNSPTGYTWHHYEKEGILRLVDRADHSYNFSIYHPTGKGGRDIWGGGKAGREGKIK